MFCCSKIIKRSCRLVGGLIMITEDYVSFKIAKLLKEKGFNEYCRFIYNAGVFCSVASLDCRWNEGYGELIEEKQNSDFGKYDNAISAPTLQMVMKWLREVHNIAIETEWEHLWYAYIKPMTSKPSEEDYYQCKSLKYEEVCEDVIKYCLKSLI